MRSAYAMREGDESVFGEFPDCHVLGQDVIQSYERVEDGDLRVKDIFGHPLRRKAACIHISGLNDFGKLSFGALVYEIGWYTVRAKDGGEVKFSPRDPHGVAIATSFQDLDENWGGKLHMGQWSASDGLVTLDAIETEFPGPHGIFTPADVIDRIEAVGKKRSWSLKEPQHLRAVRRLLDQMVGVSNEAGGSIPGKTLHRHRRWGYIFRPLS